MSVVKKKYLGINKFNLTFSVSVCVHKVIHCKLHGSVLTCA